MDFIEALKHITDASGVSGREAGASLAVKNIFEPYCTEVTIDSFYNVIAFKEGSKKDGLNIMMACHIDEIGFMVREITENGFIRVVNVGGIDTKILPAHEVIVHGKRDLPGIVCIKSARAQTPDERKKAETMENILIDVGYCAETVREFVKAGDFVTLKSDFSVLNNRYISAKALDNRSSVGIMYECAKLLYNRAHNSNFYFVSTSREETGAHGAIVASQRLNPDIAIVFDVGQGKTPDADHYSLFNLGKGPYITMGPQLHHELSRKLLNIAKEAKLPFQIAVSTGWTGTDASAIHVLNGGIPCVLVGIPLRYMHTSIEMVNINDFKNAVKLVDEFINHIDLNMEDLYAFKKIH